jgi:hypothetical protein
VCSCGSSQTKSIYPPKSFNRHVSRDQLIPRWCKWWGYNVIILNFGVAPVGSDYIRLPGFICSFVLDDHRHLAAEMGMRHCESDPLRLGGIASVLLSSQRCCPSRLYEARTCSCIAAILTRHRWVACYAWSFSLCPSSASSVPTAASSTAPSTPAHASASSVAPMVASLMHPSATASTRLILDLLLLDDVDDFVRHPEVFYLHCLSLGG